MPLPKPEPGLVIPYDYLWSHEHEKGQEQGRKTRPCVIVLAVVRGRDGSVKVSVAPVTHSKPVATDLAIEIPPRVKASLRLDAARSWAICSEINQFVWPGFDLRAVPGTQGAYSYGLLPPQLLHAIVDRIIDLDVKAKVKRIPRD